MVTILGWLRAEAERASCSKRSSRSVFAEHVGGRILIATLRPSCISRARYTSPMPPAPSGSTISYGPSFVPEVRAIPKAIIFSSNGLAVGPTMPDGLSASREYCGGRFSRNYFRFARDSGVIDHFPQANLSVRISCGMRQLLTSIAADRRSHAIRRGAKIQAALRGLWFSWQAPAEERLCPSRRTRRISPVWFGLRSVQRRGHHPGLRRRSDPVSESFPFHLSPASRSNLPAHK